MRIFIFLILFFLGSPMFAQIGPSPQKNAPKDVKLEEAKKMTPKQKADNVAEAMGNSLKLNDKQLKELKVAFLDYETKKEKLSKQKGLSLKELAAKKRGVEMERQAHMKRIFTPEQYKRYQLASPGG